ncbi:MAG: formate dehydrogenase accessory sulfurtransferase FdhD [Lautropia sp.]
MNAIAPDDEAPIPAQCPVTVTARRGGEVSERGDSLAEEMPVALVFNGISQAVMFATPADLEDFALGFGLAEGLLADAGELRAVDVVLDDGDPANPGVELRLEVATACEARLRSRRRALAGRTGCGLCGTESLAQLRRDLPRVPPTRVTPDALARAQRRLAGNQHLQRVTGATHAAAWCSRDGELRLMREDVGRHNALDKLIGAMVRARIDPADGFAWISSRASFEMVQKAALAGIGLLAATSAPTALAVRNARACGMALAGFVRGDDWVAYTFAERFGELRRLQPA